MITPISTLKRWLTNFKKPTQEQFWAWLDSYWHKSEKIPMDTIDGLENAIRGTASAEQLRNHLTDSQAHKELFDKKVDKEDGKTLTSNDYTNEEKRTNQANAQKRVVGLTVTGDVDKIITITFADSTVLQAPFTDKDTLPENLADIKLNSLNFNEQTGVLTGVRSDGQQLTVSLDGRYALLGHSHDDRYSQLGHTHTEYAPLSHRHHWDDIDGKPNFEYLPLTGGNINGDITLIDKVKIVARPNGNSIAFGNKQFNDLVYGEFKGIKIWGNDDNNKVVLAGGGVKNINEISPSYTTITDAHTFLDKDGAIHFGSGSNIANAPDSSFYEMVGFTHSHKNWGFIIAKNLDINDSKLYVKQVIAGSYTGWFELNGNSENISIRTYIECNHNQNGSVIFVEKSVTIQLKDLVSLDCVSFRKVFAGGQVTFTCDGKQIIYTGDTAFNGGDGSTAVVSIWNNKCYIDIRNV